ncbi:dentin matrix acidic phosphoprotein 1-like [Anolis sagrei]|uniref:dentin matrix acidic phosphoprotein 1-like n=1 Tax=Anolis sagrei TaxID=38937 RepID=UPI003521F65E
MHTKRTSLLFISLWALSQARPVSRHHGAHHMSSEEHWDTIGERNLNYIADSADVSDEDRGSRQSKSEEHVSTSHENSEGDTFLRKVSSGSFESYPIDNHDWSTRDNDDDNYFRVHQVIHRNWADDADSHEHSDLKQMNEDTSDDQIVDKISLENQNEIHQDNLYGDITKSKELFDVENDGMLYTPEQVLFTFTGNGGSDLTNDEEISGDDSFNEHNEDLGHTVLPSEGDNPQTTVEKGDQEEDNTISRQPRDSSSSSSSSESRSLDKEDNHIADYRRRHRADSYSSSQEDRYYFDDEGMQGDDATFFESHDADSDMLYGDFNSKESSQESRRGKGKHHSKAIERFARKVYHYVDADSEEDQSPEQEESKSQQEDDIVSEESSQSVEETSQSTENVLSRSREDGTSQSKEMVKSSSRGRSHSQFKETFKSRSREHSHSRSREDDRHSQSQEDDRHSQSQEDDRHSQSQEDDRHSRSQEDDRHSHSQEDDRHSWSREDGRQSQSREDGRHSRSREDDRHSLSREDNKHSQSREYLHSHSREDVHSHSKEDHKHSQSREENKHSWSREDDNHSWSREDDAHSQSRETSLVSQSREDENSPSREDDDTVSMEDIKSDSTEDSRGSYKKVVKKSKELSEKSNEYSTGKSKQQRSYSIEDVSNRAPRGSESGEVKREHSSSSEKSVSTEDSEETSEDTDESIQTDSRLSHSTSSESSKASHESTSSEDSDSHDKDLKSEEQNQSAQTSESTEEDNSHSIERDSHSREDTASIEDDSWSRSMELESRKLMFDIDHNKPLSDYDDNDCQDGY